MKLEIFKNYVELYLTELKQAGEESTPFDYDLTEAKILLTDFVQWLCDDVEDGLLADLTAEGTSMQDDGTMIFAPDEGLVIDSRGIVKPAAIIGSPEWCEAYTHRLRSESALGYLGAIQRNEEESEDE